MWKTCVIAATMAVLTLSVGSVAPPGATAARADTRSPAAAVDPVGDLLAAPAALCEVAPGYEAAARRNAESLRAMRWAPFGRAEQGWEIYSAHVAREIGTDCEPDTPGFAAALARWQSTHALEGDGVSDTRSLTAMKVGWQAARPYVALRASGVCPDPPASAGLTRLDLAEGYLGKSVELRSDVASAYRRMVEAAKAELPELATDPQLMRVFSGYRSPAYDDARCARDGNCGGAARAKCSVHRTGQAVDLVVGAAPGFGVDSSADINRLHQTQGRTYRWLLANADRFGFVNYSFEPWHWEWVGDISPPDTPRLRQVAIR